MIRTRYGGRCCRRVADVTYRPVPRRAELVRGQRNGALRHRKLVARRLRVGRLCEHLQEVRLPKKSPFCEIDRKAEGQRERDRLAVNVEDEADGIHAQMRSEYYGMGSCKRYDGRHEH